nr:type II toxin-antitoxin system RelE/ParE family toxin [Pseudomonas edaphica]
MPLRPIALVATIAMGLYRAFAAIYANRPTPNGTIKNPRHIVFYRVANDDVIEVVRLLHDAMEVEVQLHLPNN